MRFLVYAVLGLVLLSLMYVRLSPHPAERWHVDLKGQGEGDEQGPGSIRLSVPSEDPMATLARLEAIILATPRTVRLAGNAAEGHASYVTRSLVFGFPDTTTVQALDDRVVVYGRLRFGLADLGVNAKRVRGWLAQL